MFDPELLLSKGCEARKENQPEEARDLFAQAVAESRWVKDPGLLARALVALGEMECGLLHRSTAIDCYSEAAEIYKGLDDRIARAEAMRHTAEIQREQNKPAEAEALYEQALEIYGTHPEAPPLGQAHALRGLALLKTSPDDHEEARLLWQGAGTLYEAAGDQAKEAECKAQVAFLLGQ